VRDLLVLLAAVLVGFFLLGFDQRTDDTGVEVGLIVAMSLALALAAPRRAVAVGLGVGLPIAAASAITGHIDIAAVVLVIALFGAGLGWLMRRGSAAAR
jgi:uncharacterized membrane protein